ncbi:MAG: SUMF1/EgtB/PvdO family nonheme iron enzyme, partial [Treponema sp.]|nr:SUMF1/EgtB/PvdO family nonheme iron enzyme [Treponema sp.]
MFTLNVYVEGTFKMKGSAYIPAGVTPEGGTLQTGAGKNDVRLFGDHKIIIAGKLTPPAACTDGIVATITPASYTAGTQLIELDTGVTDTTLEEAAAHFAVTPDAAHPDMEWVISSTGKLKNNSAPEGFVIVPGGASAVFDGSTAITGSEVFISERNLGSMKTLIVCDHEVTQKEYSEFMTWYGREVSGTEHGQAGSTYAFVPDSTYGEGDNYPAYCVSWYEAIMYCNLRSEKEGLTPVYYIMDGSTKVTSVASWALNSDYNIATTGSGDTLRYYYNSLTTNSKLDYEGTSDTDGGIQFDETADGYRHPTEAEWEYLAPGGNLTNSGQKTYS